VTRIVPECVFAKAGEGSTVAPLSKDPDTGRVQAMLDGEEPESPNVRD
jgi:hypothetical protein